MAAQAEVRFYLNDQTLMFELKKPAIGAHQGPPTHIAVKADKTHAEQYRSAYEKFRGEHPEYIASWETPTPTIEAAILDVESLLSAALKESVPVESNEVH